MMKDYMPVADSDADVPECELIEAHWTRIWSDRTRSREAAAELLSPEQAALLDPYVTPATSGAKLLHGGCGLGPWTVAYTHRGFAVIGIDLSQATVDAVQRRFPDRTPLVGDIRLTQLTDDPFDAYLSYFYPDCPRSPAR